MSDKRFIGIILSTISAILVMTSLSLKNRSIGVLSSFVIGTIYNKNIRIMKGMYHIMKNMPLSKKEEYLGNRINILFDREFEMYREYEDNDDVEERREPCIYVSNYTKDRMETLLYPMLPIKAAVLIRQCKNYENIGKRFLDRTIPTYKGCFNDLEEAVRENINKGVSVFCFSSHYNTHDIFDINYIAHLHSSLFVIAKKLGVKVAPVVLDRIDNTFGVIHNQPLSVCIGKAEMVDDVYSSMKSCRSYMIKKMTLFRDRKERYYSVCGKIF